MVLYLANRAGGEVAKERIDFNFLGNKYACVSWNWHFTTAATSNEAYKGGSVGSQTHRIRAIRYKSQYCRTLP